MRLSVGQYATYEIYARPYWNNTTLDVRSGEQYDLSAIGQWCDAQIKSGPDGYTSPWYMVPFQYFRRRPRENWFALIGSVGSDERNTFPIGGHLLWVASADGPLECYANDVPGFYFNNSGSLNLTVSRIS